MLSESHFYIDVTFPLLHSHDDTTPSSTHLLILDINLLTRNRIRSRQKVRINQIPQIPVPASTQSLVQLRKNRSKLSRIEWADWGYTLTTGLSWTTRRVNVGVDRSNRGWSDRCWGLCKDCREESGEKDCAVHFWQWSVGEWSLNLECEMRKGKEYEDGGWI